MIATSVPNTRPPTSQIVALVSDTSFTQLVSDALRNYQSTLALSRSDLANSPLITPTLVKDESSPTAEERGNGLRLVLQWAVNLLAPAPVTFPMGSYRPLDDPTWHDPRWWGYNILRHRYLEPLHPDDFVEGGRYTESLLALTGISSSDAFFDERHRAIRTVAQRLRQQLIDGQASGDLQRLALHEAVQPLEKQAEAMRVLAIASTFNDIFARNLLLEITADERINSPSSLLASLVAQRYLLTGDEGQSLWLSPVLRRYVYESQASEDCHQRHRWIARYYERQNDALHAACHWQRANEDARAVRVLLPAAPELIRELQVKELVELLQEVDPNRVAMDQWYEVQVQLSDLFQRTGQSEESLAACRRALKATSDLTQQARVYRRMGKLYEGRNQAHALRYYQQAVERFDASEPELAELLKDRGWLYFYRQEWDKAEADLQQALRSAPAAANSLQADILDAMANLERKRDQRERALAFAERALAIREQAGDLLAIAKSLGNLGFIYRAMGENQHAVLAHQEALTTYQKLDNKELMAAAWLNIGAAHYHDSHFDAAIDAYRQSLAIGQSMRLPLIELKAHYNLAEVLVATSSQEQAIRHWTAGYQQSQQHGFADQSQDFLELAQELDLPVRPGQVSANDSPLGDIAPAIDPAVYRNGDLLDTSYIVLDTGYLNADEETVMELAQRERKITARRLMAIADISRATATRRLSALVEKGLLALHGQGRGAYYALPNTSLPDGNQSLAPSTDVSRETLLALVGKQQPDLMAHFSLNSLGLLHAETMPHLNEPVKIVVRFAQPPDLAGYFDLRQYLASLVQMEVDLLPDFTLSPAQLQREVEWIWQG